MSNAMSGKSGMSVLLTGAVVQSYRLLEKGGIQDPFERLTDYLCAIARWLRQPEVTHVVYCDASGVLIPESVFGNDKFESLSADFRETTLRFGKGPTESRTIEHVMSRSRRLSENFYKCTGRLFVQNFSGIHACLEWEPDGFVIRMNDEIREADTRFFRLDRQEYFRLIRPHLRENSDYLGCNIEHVYYRYCHPSRMMPDVEIVGRFGHNGDVYEDDFTSEEKAMAGELIRKFRLTRDLSLMSGRNIT